MEQSKTPKPQTMKNPSEHPLILDLIASHLPSLRTLPWQVVADAVDAFDKFDVDHVEHLRGNIHRLIRGNFNDDSGGGCIFHLLSELDGPGAWIDSKESLTRYFTGGCGEAFRHRLEYQPAKWLVRVWDKQEISRYGRWTNLTREMVHDLCELSLMLRDVPAPTSHISTQWEALQSERTLPVE